MNYLEVKKMPLSEKAKHILNFLNGFRKFTVMIILIIIGVTFLLTGHLTGAEMVDLLRYTAVAFMTANGVEHMIKGVQAWVKGKSDAK